MEALYDGKTHGQMEPPSDSGHGAFEGIGGAQSKKIVMKTDFGEVVIRKPSLATKLLEPHLDCCCGDVQSKRLFNKTGLSGKWEHRSPLWKQNSRTVGDPFG